MLEEWPTTWQRTAMWTLSPKSRDPGLLRVCGALIDDLGADLLGNAWQEEPTCYLAWHRKLARICATPAHQPCHRVFLHGQYHKEPRLKLLQGPADGLHSLRGHNQRAAAGGGHSPGMLLIPHFSHPLHDYLWNNSHWSKADIGKSQTTSRLETDLPWGSFIDSVTSLLPTAPYTFRLLKRMEELMSLARMKIKLARSQSLSLRKGFVSHRTQTLLSYINSQRVIHSSTLTWCHQVYFILSHTETSHIWQKAYVAK